MVALPNSQIVFACAIFFIIISSKQGKNLLGSFKQFKNLAKKA
jgi:hypothetical protein